MFWIISLVILLAAGLLVLWPLLQADSRWKAPGLVVLLLIPALAFWQYPWVGSPRALQPESIPAVAQENASMDEMVISLREKLTESPADLEGWVLLGRTYKTMQDYPAALEALETANRLVPEEPVVLVELVEARLFASGNPMITPQMVQTLELAVAKQPDLQKGWWLLGLAAAQQGDDSLAIDYWRKVLQGMEPGSPVAQTIQAQIAEAESRMDNKTPAADIAAGAEAAAGWQSASIRIVLGPAAQATLAALPPAASLFLIARSKGESSGPPLAVRRIPQPEFPLELRLSDADSMLPQRPVSGFEELQLQARISIAGDPMASAGDWQSTASILPSGQSDGLELVIDQQVD
ncbi:MAG TPA: hypothetical protein VJN01_16255 [Xanthomonadales bacterium]|nr:hypothetical protein [Xanthomonadales bacterium]